MLVTAGTAVIAAALAATAGWAGSAPFVDNTVTASQSGNTLTVSGKEAGLGNLPQVHIVVTATAACINGGGKHPSAANKTSVSAAGNFPVQNGQATFTLSATATFTPSCSPPMTVQFGPVTVSDTTNGVSTTIP
jgi:hypothetical protein